MTSLLTRNDCDDAPATPAAPKHPHLLGQPAAPLWINDLVNPARGHIAGTRDARPHVLWDRGGDLVVRALCGAQGVVPTIAPGQPGKASAIANRCADCRHLDDRHRADYGLPPLHYNPAGGPAAPTHSMVLAAALACSRLSPLGITSLTDHRTVDDITRATRSALHPWDVVSEWRKTVDPTEWRSRWEAATGTVTRLYPELIDAQGSLPDVDTASNLDYFLPPARRGAAAG